MNYSRILFLSRDSRLPFMLKELLGRNCHTCAVLSLDGSIKVDLFKEIQIFTHNLSQIVNFPVINDIWIQVTFHLFFLSFLHLQQRKYFTCLYKCLIVISNRHIWFLTG